MTQTLSINLHQQHQLLYNTGMGKNILACTGRKFYWKIYFRSIYFTSMICISFDMMKYFPQHWCNHSDGSVRFARNQVL